MANTITVTNPHDGSVIKELPLATDEEVESAIAIAYEKFNDRKNWLPAHKRVEILENLIPLMENQKQELINIALSEGGKPYRDSQVEVERAINGVKLGLVAFHQLHGKEIPMGITPSSAGRKAFTFYEPAGVVASLSAFNHPLNLIVHQTIPAIVAGCPFIVKPAPDTPLSCIKFVELLHEAGLPKDWGKTILCSNENAEKLATGERTAFLSFIGSAKVGWYLRSKLSPGAHCALEHGGAAPVIIDSSVSITDEMIESLVRGAYYHAGQVCVSVQRMFVAEDLADEFIKKFVARVKELKTGNPADKDTDIGPLIRVGEIERVSSWVSEAVSAGAEILCGGKKISDHYYEPTVLKNPSEDSKVTTQEIFGPVSCIYTFKDQDDAINKANSLPFCFQASVFSKDIDNAMYVVQQLKALAVMVNDHTAFRVDWMPFGGSDISGLGIGGIEYSARDMSHEKLMVMKSKVF